MSELGRLRITTTDLLEQLRIQNCPSISDVEYAIMESNGQLSVIQKAENNPVTPKDMQLNVTEGIDQNTFENKLRKAGITAFKDVFLAFCDENKQFHIYLSDKNSGPFAKEVII